jgi:hypothetical protein
VLNEFEKEQNIKRVETTLKFTKDSDPDKIGFYLLDVERNVYENVTRVR